MEHLNGREPSGVRSQNPLHSFRKRLRSIGPGTQFTPGEESNFPLRQEIEANHLTKHSFHSAFHQLNKFDKNEPESSGITSSSRFNFPPDTLRPRNPRRSNGKNCEQRFIIVYGSAGSSLAQTSAASYTTKLASGYDKITIRMDGRSWQLVITHTFRNSVVQPRTRVSCARLFRSSMP